MVLRKALRGMGISDATAIIRCSSSISSATLSAGALRNGNVHSADDWKALLAPVIARYAERDIMRFFRGDAAFAIPELYETLEAAGYFYAIRLKKKRCAGREDRPSVDPTRGAALKDQGQTLL